MATLIADIGPFNRQSFATTNNTALSDALAINRSSCSIGLIFHSDRARARSLARSLVNRQLIDRPINHPPATLELSQHRCGTIPVVLFPNRSDPSLIVAVACRPTAPRNCARCVLRVLRPRKAGQALTALFVVTSLNERRRSRRGYRMRPRLRLLDMERAGARCAASLDDGYPFCIRVFPMIEYRKAREDDEARVPPFLLASRRTRLDETRECNANALSSTRISLSRHVRDVCSSL